MSTLRTIPEQELKDILDKHGKWLRNEIGGERADLSFANLRYADLRSANLRSADLTYADLKSSNLRSADLTYADLRYADLTYADLRYADLTYANLRSADLTYANLRSADLTYADLRYADLTYANGFKFKPLQVVNTKYFITILDDHVLWGCKKLSFEDLSKFQFTDCTEKWELDEFNLNKKIITEMISYYRKETHEQR